MAYGTAAMMRQFAAGFLDKVTVDATLLLYCTNISDPVIDGTLAAWGYTVPDTTPDLVKTISSMMGAGHALSLIAQKQSDGSEHGRWLIEEANKLLYDLCRGKLRIAAMTRASGYSAFEVASTPDTLHEEAGIVGKPENWKWYTEDRDE